MESEDATLPRDEFSGRSATWLIDTFRTPAGTTALAQRMSAEDPLRLVLPPAVMSAIER